MAMAMGMVVKVRVVEAEVVGLEAKVAGPALATVAVAIMEEDTVEGMEVTEDMVEDLVAALEGPVGALEALEAQQEELLWEALERVVVVGKSMTL